MSRVLDFSKTLELSFYFLKFLMVCMNQTPRTTPSKPPCAITLGPLLFIMPLIIIANPLAHPSPQTIDTIALITLNVLFFIRIITITSNKIFEFPH